MRIVNSKELGNLVMWRPLMLLDKTLLGPAYVESVVSRSPALIASQAGKRLPLELWDMIINFAKRYTKDHRFFLVQPIRLQTSVRGDELVCCKFQRWSPFGNIRKSEEIEIYRFYLAHPDKLSRPGMNSSCPNPFGDPLTREFGSLCTFPTALLKTAKFLHVELTVRDIIRYLEDWDCKICSGTRVTGADILSGFVPQNKEYSQLLGGVPPSAAEPLICPLCVGLNYTWQSINTRNRFVPPMSREDYRSWLVKRLESFFTRPR
ncbi:hypothetical protein FOQG_12528 [Fusarium oxysporum f. sp. raphani 54005]|uniref:Uncharacterized protein n=2 Tax=Fusarium oxysporum f. sp. raphani TaxID=96318 RepID=X0BM04_FUSOX|nr:hypothetical protein FOQG_12528 [Fusarium oxysporum f. sp. raphani 54005]KAG7425847.1 hypothetical protein Forpi1262_v013497 [Fusarium oxysporum f. sp. raphani]KAJ4062127.1 hypothetical protein NW763_005540 [Fusarium oxysporum]WKT50948.1 hypothetical protein QSH57_015918 [Fusarium oxysporum f. sp. vasinfectum]